MLLLPMEEEKYNQRKRSICFDEAPVRRSRTDYVSIFSSGRDHSLQRRVYF